MISLTLWSATDGLWKNAEKREENGKENAKEENDKKENDLR